MVRWCFKAWYFAVIEKMMCLQGVCSQDPFSAGWAAIKSVAVFIAWYLPSSPASSTGWDTVPARGSCGQEWLLSTFSSLYRHRGRLVSACCVSASSSDDWWSTETCQSWSWALLIEPGSLALSSLLLLRWKVQPLPLSRQAAVTYPTLGVGVETCDVCVRGNA